MITGGTGSFGNAVLKGYIPELQLYSVLGK